MKHPLPLNSLTATISKQSDAQVWAMDSTVDVISKNGHENKVFLRKMAI